MAHETIVTMFTSVIHAEAAKHSLTEAGFREKDIDIISGERLRSEGDEARHPGLWQRLFGNTLEEDQAEVYDDALRTGGVVLSLRADEEDTSRAIGILDAHEEMTARSPAVPAEENTGSAAVAGAGELSDPDRHQPALSSEAQEEDVIRLAEERLEVGKREINEGPTRIRRYTVTENVSETIPLHEQHAEILRRPSDTPHSAESPDWSDKTVDVEETHEQPVINKTAQIKEEVIVRREQSDRIETINDSVRRQEVEIDHPSEVIDEVERSVIASAPPQSLAKRAEGDKGKRPDASDELTIQKNKFDEKF